MHDSISPGRERERERERGLSPREKAAVTM
jgi:hypothetical protein